MKIPLGSKNLLDFENLILKKKLYKNDLVTNGCKHPACNKHN